MAVHVVGAGLSGLATASYLADAGCALVLDVSGEMVERAQHRGDVAQGGPGGSPL